MSTFVLCVGCGEPLYGFLPCQWCTCEWCGNDLLVGFCSLCDSRNLCVYYPNPNSFDCPPDSYHPQHPTYETYSCDSYGNDSYFGYDCTPLLPLNYESEPSYIENYNSYPYDSLSFPQQYPCCEDCGGLSEADHCQPPQYTVNHPIVNAHNDLLNSQTKLMEQITSMCEMVGQFIQKKHEEEQVNDARYWKISAYFDNDDDYNFAITPIEPVDSLIMGNEHLNTISATESDKFIKSSVENLVSNPSESKGKNGCDVPACFATFSNVLFDADYEFDSSDDQSLIMSSITAQQTKLDLELVPKENRLDIKKCNGRIQSTQIYGAILPECLTSPAMKESKAYKTYLGYTTGAVPPKISKKFKKTYPSKKDSDLVPVDKELVTKGKRVKRSVKKSLTKQAICIVIREPTVETKSKRKEKVNVTRGKGIKLLSEVALTKESQMKEVGKKSLRDFHKLHPSGSGTVYEKPPRVDKITPPPVTSEGTNDQGFLM
nr:hypothetical protein [Tanacetum cinerariifolium]